MRILFASVRMRLTVAVLIAITTIVAGCGGSDDDDFEVLTPTAESAPESTATARPVDTPTSVPPTATPAPNATANAGNDIDVKIGGIVTLNGSASVDPDGDPLTYKWVQVFGPDATGGVGFLTGATPLFTAPDRVSTVIFDLRVEDGNGEGKPDDVQINVMENTDTALFVDGDAGSDASGDGTRDNPFASISFAISQVSGPDYDIYVRSLDDEQSYVEEETLRPQTSISLYGGFGQNWSRDVNGNRTRLSGASSAIQLGTVNEPAWVSGFEISSSDADSPGESVFGISASSGSETLVIEDNTIISGNAASGSPGGTSYGLSLSGISEVIVRRNRIHSGSGGAGETGKKGNNGGAASTDGSDGRGATGGAGGKGGVASANGGKGGNGGTGLIPEDGKVGGGTGGGIGDKVGAGRVGDGGGGAGGKGGNGGSGATGQGVISDSGLFESIKGNNGARAGNGAGGGAGGGGAGGVGLDGGGGGGAGGGGQAGAGGEGGYGGGASIGIFLYKVTSSTIEGNQIIAGNGASAGNGGAGGTGGSGSDGGVGAPNVCSFLGCNVGRSGDGGEGGGGGSGGIGGQGGGGAGGASYGVMFGPESSATIKDNQIRTGAGGNAGVGGAAGLGGSPGGSGGSTGGAGGCCSFLLETAGKPGTGGQGGFSYSVFDLDTTDDFTPSLSGNTFTAGQGGQGRAINGKPGDVGETNF